MIKFKAAAVPRAAWACSICGSAGPRARCTDGMWAPECVDCWTRTVDLMRRYWAKQNPMWFLTGRKK